MRRSPLLLWVLAFLLSGYGRLPGQTGSPRDPNRSPVSTRMLFYDQPASLWTDALPIGNGRLGGMVYGRTQEEIIKLNENTVWAGGPYDSNGKGGFAYLEAIRKLVFEGKGREAEALFEKTMMARSWETAPYQPLGNLKILSPGQALVEGYKRELLLDSGISRVSYSVGNDRFARTAFCSYPDQVMVVRLEASEPGTIDSLFTLEGVTNPAGTGDEKWGLKVEGEDTLILFGTTRSFESSDKRETYECRIKAVPEGGMARVVRRDPDMCYAPGIRVKGANAVTLLLAASSSYVDYHDVSGDPAAKDRKVLRDLDGKSYQDILRDHVADFGALFNRVSLDLGGEDTSAIPTDRRFALFAGGKDRDFPALFFQYGRYLMISSSRKGGVPANLQGLWNEDFGPAWNGGYTTNINFEMNYWPSDLANLSECRIPQLETIRNMRGPGGETARLNFGADGWTCNLNTDIWLASAPIYGAYWGTWQGATAWYGCDLWDHYLFTRDPAFLEGYYPLMRDAVLFFDQTLVRHPKYGWLVTNPSSSPENGPGGDPAWTRNPDGTRIPPVGICAGPTCDNAMIGELFRHFIEASTALGKDGALRESVSRKLPQLPPYRIGRYGQLQEWLEDLDNPNDRHRHNSQLWGLYPGTSIDPLKTPRLAEAARVVLDHKGDESTGWSLAWRANLWARLRDGDRALKLVTRLLRLVDSPDYVSGPGGTYANLMDSHPPFQIDGNFGGTAAIAEMLLQSHNGYLEFLPALPRAWDRGTVSGLKARGAFTVAVSWENGRATSAALSSEKGLPCVLRSASGIVVTAGNERMAVTREGDHLYRFRTQPGRTYRISFS